MSPLIGIQKKITDRFLRMQINRHVEELVKKGIAPTVEQVLQDASNSINVLCQQGYIMEEITGMVSEAIGRHKQ